MTLITYKCPKCESQVEGTENDLACNLYAGVEPLWECIQCECGGMMLPLVTDSTRGPIIAYLAERYKEATRDAYLLHAELELLPRAAWKVNQKEGAQHKHWKVEINGMELHYWPGMNRYAYVPLARDKPMDKLEGGFDFVKTLLDDYELRQAARKA